MARARWLLPLLAASLLVTSCYFAVDWDGLAGPDAPSDAGSDVVDAVAIDAGDASDASDADAAEACPDGGFCDDFERTTVLGPWNDTNTVTGSTLAITNHAYAGSGALHVSLGATEGARALVERTFPASTSMRLRYQYFESTATRVHGITPIGFGYSDRDEILIVGLEGDTVKLYEQELMPDGTETYFNKYNDAPRLTNQWVEVIIEVTLGSTGHVKFSYGGLTVTDSNLARKYGATEVSARIGENYSMAGDPESFDIDDVQVSWTPSD